jgi:D-alanyl-D-alanine carboxypeptidase (penicillin-binding protein 5/6)
VRRLLALSLLALVFAAPAHAGAPPVEAHAYVIVDARTGEVLASSHPHERVQIASITKLMTVLLTLERHKLTDVVTVDARAANVGEEAISLYGGERLTVHDLLEGALIQSANNAADALALSLAPSYPAFATLMNAKAQQLGLRDTHFERPDGLDADDEYSSAADVTKLARIVMRNPFVRATVAKETATISTGETLHTWDDLLTEFPQTIGVKTGHTDDAGWCQVAAARGRGVTVYATLLGSPSRAQRNEDLESLLIWGLAQFRVVPAVHYGYTYATAAVPYGGAPLDLVGQMSMLTVARLGHPLTETVVARTAVRLPVRVGDVLGTVTIRDRGRFVGRRNLVASRTINKPGVVRRVGWYAGRTLHHLAHFF